MEKKFKPFQKVLIRRNWLKEWMCDFYSHYKEPYHSTLTLLQVDDKNILPYEGNEELVGTTNEPEPSIRLEKGEMVLAKTDNGNWVLATYKEHSELPWNNIDVVFSNGHCVSTSFIVRFSEFNPSNMEEMKKHILCVKNGKIIRYKG